MVLVSTFGSDTLQGVFGINTSALDEKEDNNEKEIGKEWSLLWNGAFFDVVKAEVWSYAAIPLLK